MSVGGPSMWNRTGRLLTKVPSRSHQVPFCVFFPLLQPEVLSLRRAHLLCHLFLVTNLFASTDTDVHTRSARPEQALPISAGSLLLLSHCSCLHPASASLPSTAFFTALEIELF